MKVSLILVIIFVCGVESAENGKGLAGINLDLSSEESSEQETNFSPLTLKKTQNTMMMSTDDYEKIKNILDEKDDRFYNYSLRSGALNKKIIDGKNYVNYSFSLFIEGNESHFCSMYIDVKEGEEIINGINWDEEISNCAGNFEDLVI